MKINKRFFFLLTSILSVPVFFSGCKLFEKCKSYMDICLISEEKEKDLLDTSNISNNSQLYKATFNSYKMRLESIRSQEIFSNNKTITKAPTWEKMINDMRTDSCKFFSQSEVTIYNTQGIGPRLLDLLKDGQETFCDL